MYVRHKVIKGHVYYYLVRGERQDGKVKQKVVRYLGKMPGGFSGGAGGGYELPENAATTPVDALGTTQGADPQTDLRREVWREPENAPAASPSQYVVAAPVGTVLSRDEGRSTDGAAIRYDVVKVNSGVSWRQYRDGQLIEEWFSPRPYRLGQPSDAMVDECVNALFILWCRATGRDPQALYHKAYGHESYVFPQTYNLNDQEEQLRQAYAEGIKVPAHWGPKEFQGLLDSLGEISLHELATVLKAEAAPTEPRRVTPSLSTAVMNRERTRALVDQALDDLNDALATGNSEALTAYLNAMARFRTYSLSNQMSIVAQCPHATRVAGYREWKKRGRYVRKGEKGILITAPVIRKSRSDDESTENTDSEAETAIDTVVGYRPVYVFDVSQTEGEPLPTLDIHEASGDPGAHTDKLKTFIASQGISLEYTTDLRSGVLGSSSGGRIRIRQGLSPVEEFTTLAHEVAHELLHHAPAKRSGKTVVETEAEAVSHVVSTAIGLKTTDATADYIRLYRGDVDTLRASLETIRRTANLILDGLQREPAKS